MPESTLFISSGEIYGANPPFEVQEDFDAPIISSSSRSAYPESKLAAERILWHMGEEGATKPLVARLFHSFGPGLRDADGRSFGDFLWGAARGKNLELLSSGSAIRTFLYLEDAVAGLLTVLTKGTPGEAYNVGSKNPMEIAEFANLISRVAGVRVVCPSSRAEPLGGYLQSPSQVVVPSITKLSNLGWKQMIPIETGVKRSFDWIRRQTGGGLKWNI
jgi:dTDP-glucose 4,6-dehydratase